MSTQLPPSASAGFVPPQAADGARPEEHSSRLASYMAHELRAPLTAIHAALLMMEDQFEDRLGDDGRRLMTMAVRNSERLDRLICDILDFEKMRAGRLKLDCEPIHPEPMLAEAAYSLLTLALSKKISLVCVPPEEPLPRVLADNGRTVQVLINVLSNAIKFTPAGGRIELSIEPGGDRHPGSVVFKVEDSGPGIPEEDLEKVFRCFEQSALGEKTSKGTGLGLTLARMMIEHQGGRIWAESRPGRGATVYFTLPVVWSDGSRRGPGMFGGLFRRLNAALSSLNPEPAPAPRRRVYPVSPRPGRR